MNLRLKIERTLDRLFGAYDDPLPETQEPELVALSQRFAIKVITDHSSASDELTYQPLDARQKRFFAELLDTEMGLYPQEIITRAAFERLVLCQKLSCAGTDIAGLAQIGLHVVDTLFLDADRMTKSWNYSRKCFHHELFHAIDYHDDIFHYLDPDWRHLNKEGFAYYRHPNFDGNRPSDHPGFLTTYSMTSIHEDKAELFCHLIVNHADVLTRCQNDPFLFAKVERMKAKLADFCPQFDEDFWYTRNEASHNSQPNKHSFWHSYHEQELEHNRLISNAARQDKVTFPYTIKETRKNDRKVWVAVPAMPGSPARTFYSYNKLSTWLTKAGCTNIPTKDFLSAGPCEVELDT